MSEEIVLPRGREAAVEVDEGYEVGVKSVMMEVDNIMRLPERPVRDHEWMVKREKHRLICKIVTDHMLKHGKLWNTGSGPVYVPELSRKNIPIIEKGNEILAFLMQYGITPGDPVAAQIIKYLVVQSSTYERNLVILMSYYDTHSNTLFVNEYNGKYLKITKDGVERMRNGDEGMLFDWGDHKCDPLEADLVKANQWQRGALSQFEKSMLTTEILDTIHYAEDGVGRKSGHLLLTTAILGLYFNERIKATPILAFKGAGGSMKSALCTKVGKLIQGKKFMPTDTPEGQAAIQEVKNLAINHPFICLDEANRLKELSNILKVIATGGKDVRRVLYTTSTMIEQPYQARMWMTMNTGDPSEETVSSRMLIIDAAARTEATPYRATIYLEWTDQERNAIWTELVGRLRAAVRELSYADRAGEGDLTVSHRMSDFFVFGLSLARQEGGDMEHAFREAMDAVDNRQQTSITDSSEIVDMLERVPKVYENQPKTAKEWSVIMTKSVGHSNHRLREKASNKNSVAWHLNANENMLRRRFGMTKQQDKHKNVTYYSFSKLVATSNPDIDYDDTFRA